MRKFFIIWQTILLLGWGLFGLGENRTPNYVFLFIGDGMGNVQIVAGEMSKKFKENRPLVFTQFPIKGQMRTSSANHPITDSAAAITAMACGVKTNNGMLGLSPSGEKLISIAEIAHQNQWKIGILSSVSLDHATPAGFYAKVSGRQELSTIAYQLVHTPFEFFGGGGLAGQKGIDGNQDNLQLAIKKGFKIIRTRNDLEAISPTERVLAFNHRLANEASLPWAIDITKDDIRLGEFTQAAIRHLQSTKFFIMVEGGKIDWACHANDLASCVMEILEFDRAIEEAVRFFENYPHHTLIIVTADHETGGLKQIRPINVEVLFKIKKSSEELTKIVRKMQREGSKLEDILMVLKENMDTDFTQEEIQLLQKAWEDAQHSRYLKELYGKEHPLILTWNRIITQRAGFQFTSLDHTAVDVPVYAWGIGSELFEGTYENTELFYKLITLMRLPQVIPQTR